MMARWFGFGRKAAVPAPVSSQVAPSLHGVLVSPQEIAPYQAWLLYMNVGPYAKVVDMIADAVASLMPVVHENGEAVDGHPVFNFLHQPGFNRTRRRFFKEATVQYLVTGTTYLHVMGHPMAPPAAIDILKTKYVSPTPGSDMWPDFYLYAEGTRSIQFRRDMSNPRDWKWVDTGSGLGEIMPVYDLDGNTRGVGLPRLNAIRADVDLRLKGILHNASVLDKGARLSGILSSQASMTEEQEHAVMQQIKAMMSGAAGAGAVLFASGGTFDFKELSQSMKDMDFAKLIGIVEDSIASRYNVPVTLFRTDAQTNNNYETAWNILYDQAVLPTFDIIASSLSVLFSERMRADIKIKHDSLTSPILARQAVARSVELHRENLISRNEARQMVGFEPVLGGDVIYGPMGEVPQGEDLFTGIDGGRLVSRDVPPGGTPRLAIPKPRSRPEEDMEEDEKRALAIERRRVKNHAVLADFADLLAEEG